jgi:hypothetical protein
MKFSKALFGVFSIATATLVHAAAPSWEWVKIASSTGNDAGSGVAVDSTGNIYFSCFIHTAGQMGTTSVPAQSYFWAMLGQDGSIQKYRSGGVGGATGNINNGAPTLAFKEGVGLVTTASFNNNLSSPSFTGAQGTILFACFDNQFATRWAKVVGTGAYAPSVPAISQTGDIAIANSFQSAQADGISLSTINGSIDALIVKSASNGQISWMKRGGGVLADFGTSCCFDSLGNLYVGGEFQSATFSLGPLTLSGANFTSGFLAKLGTDGTPIWLKNFQGANTVAYGISSVKVDGNGEVVAAGISNTDNSNSWYSSPSTTGFLTRVASAGNTIWTKSIGSLAIRDLVIDSSGNIYVLGLYRGTLTLNGISFGSKGDSDIFVGKFTSGGTLIWGKSAGGVFADDVGQIALGPNGSVFIAGTVHENASFDSIFFDGKGGGDAFVAKLSDPALSDLPVLTAQPTGGSSYFGGQITISVAATSSTPLTYKWFRNGFAMSGQTSATLTIPSVRPSDDASYYVEVTNQYGTVRSDSVHLIVRGEAPVVVTTLAGTNVGGFKDSADPRGARFFAPDSPAIQNDGTIVVPDAGNHAVRLIDPSGAVGTLSGKGTAGLDNGPASVATFNVPIGAAISAGWDIFIADGFNNVVRKINALGTRSVSTYAGTGEEGFQNGGAAQAKFSFPNDLVCAPDGTLFVTEFTGHRVRMITTDGTVSTFAGTGVAGFKDGPGGQAQFNEPAGIARDAAGNLYVTEWLNHTIRKITPAGVVSTIAGAVGQSGFVDGPALTAARLSSPNGIAVDGKGNIFFTEHGNSSVRRIDALGDVLTLVGTAGRGFQDGARTDAQMFEPGGVAAHPDGSLIVTDTGNNAVRRVVWQANPNPTEAAVLIELNPSITIFGIPGKTYRVEASESMVSTNWVVVGEVTLGSAVETWFDSQPVTRTQRYYRAVLVN